MNYLSFFYTYFFFTFQNVSKAELLNIAFGLQIKKVFSLSANKESISLKDTERKKERQRKYYFHKKDIFSFFFSYFQRKKEKTKKVFLC